MTARRILLDRAVLSEDSRILTLLRFIQPKVRGLIFDGLPRNYLARFSRIA